MKRLFAGDACSPRLIPLRAPAPRYSGEYTGATVTLVNGHTFGGYLNVSNHLAGGLTQLRMSLYPSRDFGFQGGLSRLGSGGGVDNPHHAARGRRRALADGEPDWKLPADLSLGASLGVETADDYKVVTLGPVVHHEPRAGGRKRWRIRSLRGRGAQLRQPRCVRPAGHGRLVPLRLGLESRLSPSAT